MPGRRVCGLGLVFAKQEAAEGGSQQLDRLAAEIDERLHRAALKVDAHRQCRMSPAAWAAGDTRPGQVPEAM